jgi:hypothetical protein
VLRYSCEDILCNNTIGSVSHSSPGLCRHVKIQDSVAVASSSSLQADNSAEADMGEATEWTGDCSVEWQSGRRVIADGWACQSGHEKPRSVLATQCLCL